ncbi:hypothetical protein Tco_0482235 [Tanacetum coccineum]
MLLKKLPEKLGESPTSFLIPCNFPEWMFMATPLADLGVGMKSYASFLFGKKIYLPRVTPTRILETYLKDDSISPEIDHADFNPEEDICLIEKLLNNDPFQLPPMDLKQSEVTEAKSSMKSLRN